MNKAEIPTSSYVQLVPDHCDRIVWRNRYYHLPLKQPQAEAVPINYSPLYEFADKNRVSYNELCSAVQAAIAQQKGGV